MGEEISNISSESTQRFTQTITYSTAKGLCQSCFAKFKVFWFLSGFVLIDLDICINATVKVFYSTSEYQVITW